MVTAISKGIVVAFYPVGVVIQAEELVVDGVLYFLRADLENLNSLDLPWCNLVSFICFNDWFLVPSHFGSQEDFGDDSWPLCSSLIV